MQSQRVYLVFVPDQYRPVPQVFLSWHLSVKEITLMQEEASMGFLLLSKRANGFCSNLNKLLVFWPGEAFQVRKALLLLLTVPFGGLAPSLSSHRGNIRCLLSPCLYLLRKSSQKSRQTCMMLYWEWEPALYFQQDGGPKGEGVGKLGVFLLLPGGRKFPTCFPAVLSPRFPVIPAAPLTLILALESAALLAFPSVAETRQTEGQLPGAVKAVPDAFGNSCFARR